jgi:hypothetical protein
MEFALVQFVFGLLTDEKLSEIIETGGLSGAHSVCAWYLTLSSPQPSTVWRVWSPRAVSPAEDDYT